MISDQAKSGLEQIFKLAISANIAGECEINPESDDQQNLEQEFVMLMISSMTFRILSIFNLNTEECAKHFFTKQTELNQNISDENYRDAFFEFTNMCCGTMNRELNKHFRHLGMSTPTILKTESALYLSALNPEYIKRFIVTVNQVFSFNVTFCVVNFHDLDFKYEMNKIEHDTGELELF